MDMFNSDYIQEKKGHIKTSDAIISYSIIANPVACDCIAFTLNDLFSNNPDAEYENGDPVSNFQFFSAISLTTKSFTNKIGYFIRENTKKKAASYGIPTFALNAEFKIEVKSNGKILVLQTGKYQELLDMIKANKQVSSLDPQNIVENQTYCCYKK